MFNCTAGAGFLEALKLAGEENLKGKILLDVANPLDFSKGFPPSLLVCNTDSLGERVQKALPATKAVKTLNTINCNVTVNPGLVPGNHTIFVSGNDPQARKTAASWLAEWFGSIQNPNFTVRVVQGPRPAGWNGPRRPRGT